MYNGGVYMVCVYNSVSHYIVEILMFIGGDG
jgi:hypothetical protein